ncbi:acetyltransferase (GNAT) family protein [Litoreibacter meonggei]|uniref:Acetyltransferase (GNAT) family protein n=1 Tax=Litoreibacter meonggei TaxID=1049199 RepID=A0A497X636_9RHOB|nr:GNAT family N-acetyltransferase [Litoreibacter meonggei]RLJ60757.1 acetyltransferase (GNAT) family protein [Litoreibacter meonggei]
MIYSDLIPDNFRYDRFFQGWPKKPSQEMIDASFKNSDSCTFAISDDGQVAGFCCSLSDRNIFSFISLLEVLPEYQGKGIGSRLIEETQRKYKTLYSLDLVCDDKMIGFYKEKGFKKLNAMSIRRFENL